MDKTYRTAVVLIPPQDVWPPIQAIRQQHDRHLRRWMPHITLLYPFRPRDTWPALLEQIEEACRRVPPFRVKLSALRTFRHRGSYTMWLAPEPKEALVALQTALWQVAPEYDDTRRYSSGFTPHLSVDQVGAAEGREQAELVVSTLQQDWKPIQFRVTEVQMIWRNEPPDDVFRVGHWARLGIEG